MITYSVPSVRQPHRFTSTNAVWRFVHVENIVGCSDEVPTLLGITSSTHPRVPRFCEQLKVINVLE